ncbi:MAG TPA: FecR domain-containing protein [Chitinophagaceae bacterium]|nr:FecR domain-containing protein [Chitinophagaceae bacterium]
MQTDERLHFLFRKYLENSCTKEELTELLALSQEEGLGKNLTGELQEYWKSLDTQKLQDEINWAPRYRNIIDIARSAHSFDHSLKSKIIKLQAWKVAVAVLIITGVSIIVWQAVLPGKSTEVASADAPAKPNDSSSQRQLLNLPDGSTVILNANSKLEYPPDFSTNSRDVYLNGEAYFDVKHNPEKPFIVHTGSISTKVLGTAFNIHAYRSQRFVEVTVTRGKVEVKAKEKLLGVLQKNEQITFNTGTEDYARKVVSPDPVIAWRKNELYFDDITFAEAALVLSNRYHVTIEFTNEKIRDCQFSAAFNNSTTLEHALTVICELNNASYRTEENKILIEGEGCE